MFPVSLAATSRELSCFAGGRGSPASFEVGALPLRFGAMDEFMAYQFTGFSYPVDSEVPVPSALLSRPSLLTEDLIV